MDISQSVPIMEKRQKKNFKAKKEGRDSLKVVYISSPMKVKTSATRFMSLVQELTGKNSDIAQYMDLNHNKVREFREIIDLNDGANLETKEEMSTDRFLSSISNSDDTITCNSNSFFEHVPDGLTPQMEEQFYGILGSNSFCDPSLVDVLGSYDEL